MDFLGSMMNNVEGWRLSALDVALGATTRQTLAARPTGDLQAWDTYLRGEAAWGNGNTGAPELIRQAQVLFETAVHRDTAFALAWARLGSDRKSVV